MYKIIKKEKLTENIYKMIILAPLIAKKAQPGQFVILRLNEKGERIPLTISDFDRDRGTVTIVFQVVGLTTKMLEEMNEGEEILDFVGPLGNCSELKGYKKAIVIGGGLGTAIALPVAKKLKELGCDTKIIAGFRNKDFVILEKEMKKASNELIITTDDGSYGEKGFVTNVLDNILNNDNSYDLVFAIGPLPMMKFVSKTTEKYNVFTQVSMNTIMIDGTGMCGGCRLTVGGKIKFACVDGPEFDGHLVDFDEVINRSTMFKKEETHQYCRLFGGALNE